MGTNQQFSLRWNNYLNHITDAFDSLREDEYLVDVTLCCEGRKIKAHRMLLSACSSYFRDIFKDNPCHHPVIVFHNVKYEDLLALVAFMYRGEVNVEQDSLSSFLNTAELLEVQGLTSGTGKSEDVDEVRGEQATSKTPRKQSSPKPYHRPESPSLGLGSKRKKVLQSPAGVPASTEEQLSDTSPPPPPAASGPPPPPPLLLAEVKTEFDFFQAGSPLTDTDNLKEPAAGGSAFSKNDSSFDNSYSDENADAASDIGAHAGSSNELSSIPESLQVMPFNAWSNCFEDAFDGKCEDLSMRSEEKITEKKVFAHGLWRRLHPSLKRFGCDECGKVFKHPRSLDHHKKMHEGRTTCPFCRRVFGRMYALRLHMSSSHPNLPPLPTRHSTKSH